MRGCVVNRTVEWNAFSVGFNIIGLKAFCCWTEQRGRARKPS